MFGLRNDLRLRRLPLREGFVHLSLGPMLP